MTPGGKGIVKSPEEALEIAKQIRYPVIIKATAGGGGKGMRVCHNDVTLVNSLKMAQAEAELSFEEADEGLTGQCTAVMASGKRCPARWPNGLANRWTSERMSASGFRFPSPKA